MCAAGSADASLEPPPERMDAGEDAQSRQDFAYSAPTTSDFEETQVVPDLGESYPKPLEDVPSLSELMAEPASPEHEDTQAVEPAATASLNIPQEEYEDTQALEPAATASLNIPREEDTAQERPATAGMPEQMNGSTQAPAGEEMAAIPDEPCSCPRSDSEDDWVPKSIPPPILTEKAIDSRLRRIFSPRCNGDFLVSEDFIKMWQDIKGGGRDKIRSLFERSAYSPDTLAQY